MHFVSVSYKFIFYAFRCLDANLVEIPVEVESPDHHYYHVWNIRKFIFSLLPPLLLVVKTTFTVANLMEFFVFHLAACTFHNKKSKCFGRADLGK